MAHQLYANVFDILLWNYRRTYAFSYQEDSPWLQAYQRAFSENYHLRFNLCGYSCFYSFCYWYILICLYITRILYWWIISFSIDQYARIGCKCWIVLNEHGRNYVNGNIMRFTTHYGVIWTVLIFMCYCYKSIYEFVITSQIDNTKSSKSNNDSLEAVKLLLYYPGYTIYNKNNSVEK